MTHELPNMPVIVVHLAGEGGLTVCSGDLMPLFNDSDTPRYLCPLCQYFSLRLRDARFAAGLDAAVGEETP